MCVLIIYTRVIIVIIFHVHVVYNIIMYVFARSPVVALCGIYYTDDTEICQKVILFHVTITCVSTDADSTATIIMIILVLQLVVEICTPRNWRASVVRTEKFEYKLGWTLPDDIKITSSGRYHRTIYSPRSVPDYAHNSRTYFSMATKDLSFTLFSPYITAIYFSYPLFLTHAYIHTLTHCILCVCRLWPCFTTCISFPSPSLPICPSPRY